MLYKILVTGAGSRMLSRLPSSLQSNDDQYSFISASHSDLEITNPEKVSQYLTALHPDACLHAAALTSLVECEKERGNKNGVVWKTNVEGTSNIVEACKELQIPCLFLSSASVFAGLVNNPGPYDEGAKPEENDEVLSWYGVTKREGESIVRTYSKGSVLRLASAARSSRTHKKEDLLSRIIHMYKDGTEQPYFSTQFLSLTDVSFIQHVIVQIFQKQLSGVFHASTPDQVSPYEVAEYLLARYLRRSVSVNNVSLETFFEKHKDEHLERFYPKYWGLSVAKTEKALGITFQSWKQVVEDFIEYDLKQS